MARVLVTGSAAGLGRNAAAALLAAGWVPTRMGGPERFQDQLLAALARRTGTPFP